MVGGEAVSDDTVAEAVGVLDSVLENGVMVI